MVPSKEMVAKIQTILSQRELGLLEIRVKFRKLHAGIVGRDLETSHSI